MRPTGLRLLIFPYLRPDLIEFLANLCDHTYLAGLKSIVLSMGYSAEIYQFTYSLDPQKEKCYGVLGSQLWKSQLDNLLIRVLSAPYVMGLNNPTPIIQ